MNFAESLKFRFINRIELCKQVTRMNCQYMIQAARNMDVSTFKIWLRHCRTHIGVQNLRHLATLLLILALSFGMYNRWRFTRNTTILVLCLVGLLIFSLICVITYYLSMRSAASALIRMWICYFMGIVSFTEKPTFDHDGFEQAMNALFVTSLVVQFVASFFAQATTAHGLPGPLLSLIELLELTGMIVASMTIASDMLAFSILLVSFGLTVVALRLKSFVGLLNIFLLAVLTGVYFFPKLRIRLDINCFSLSCFAVKLLIDPLLQWLFCKDSVLDRWQRFLKLSVLFRHSAILLFAVIELAYCITCAVVIPTHKEWYIVVPIFMAAATFWLLCHVIFVITCWQLMKKITICNTTFKYASDSSRNINRIMESKGVRHFSLISQRLTCVTLITTFLIAVVSWETRTVTTLAAFLVVLPLEGLVFSLLLELGRALGGRCIGYAIVAPALQHRADGATTLIAESLIQETGSRSMVILNTIERFFTHHMVHIFGCDYTSSGLTLEAVQAKLQTFFDKNTDDGPCYDTYILYYSGLSHDSGDWALTGNTILQLETIINMWKEKRDHSGARLVMILDTANSYRWIRAVQRNSREMIAVQTCVYVPPSNAEEGRRGQIGDFTCQWVVDNCTAVGADDLNWGEKGLQPEYGVSRRWTNFSFHLPTDEDIAHHWQSNFPKLAQPLVMCVSCSLLGSNIFCCCECLFRCMKRKKMLWFPPKQLDTDHGFRLIRS
ncbi:transmembrane protein 168-A-like [Tubulanus polymorphus]|uniref:transmembrane protein 168-A-like n=1 Tax=Tubulanus polymorphus TaxID=672921 RepID=UPI003DA62878